MKKFSVRKYYFVDTLVSAESEEEANEKVENMSLDLSEIQWLGDIEFENPDIREV